MIYRIALFFNGLSTDDWILYNFLTIVVIGVLVRWWLRKHPQFFKNLLLFKIENIQQLHHYTLQFSSDASEENNQIPDVKLPWYKKAVLAFVGLTVAFTLFYNFVETLRPERFYLGMCCFC